MVSTLPPAGGMHLPWAPPHPATRDGRSDLSGQRAAPIRQPAGGALRSGVPTARTGVGCDSRAGADIRWWHADLSRLCPPASLESGASVAPLDRGLLDTRLRRAETRAVSECSVAQPDPLHRRGPELCRRRSSSWGARREFPASGGCGCRTACGRDHELSPVTLLLRSAPALRSS